MNTTHSQNLSSNAGSFQALVQALHTVAVAIDAGDANAEAALRGLMAQLQADADPRCTGLFVFASGLAQRLDGSASKVANLYLRRFEVPQIELFNLLGRHVPMAGMATRIANDTMAQAIAGQQHPTLIDVGMGTGRQFAMLLSELAAAGCLPQRMTIIGIEPSAPALAEARAALTAAAMRLGMALQFHAITASAEALTDSDWQAIAAACSTRPVINASFALHHIADDAQGFEQRNAVLRRLRALQPACFVLSEPDVDHLEPRFLPRFRNCFAHFSAVFGVLDSLPLAQAERDALKVGFFGREIADILGTPEAQRSERHEAAAAWLQRLATTGFSVQAATTPMPAGSDAGVSATLRGNRVAIQARSEPVVSVFVAAV
jgi:SAM-dependent methyltransferase